MWGNCEFRCVYPKVGRLMLIPHDTEGKVTGRFPVLGQLQKSLGTLIAAPS
jgi:hypothetical protein